eukprot:882324_1
MFNEFIESRHHAIRSTIQYTYNASNQSILISNVLEKQINVRVPSINISLFPTHFCVSNDRQYPSTAIAFPSNKYQTKRLWDALRFYCATDKKLCEGCAPFFDYVDAKIHPNQCKNLVISSHNLYSRECTLYFRSKRQSQSKHKRKSKKTTNTDGTKIRCIPCSNIYRTLAASISLNDESKSQNMDIDTEPMDSDHDTNSAIVCDIDVGSDTEPIDKTDHRSHYPFSLLSPSDKNKRYNQLADAYHKQNIKLIRREEWIRKFKKIYIDIEPTDPKQSASFLELYKYLGSNLDKLNALTNCHHLCHFIKDQIHAKLQQAKGPNGMKGMRYNEATLAVALSIYANSKKKK